MACTIDEDITIDAGLEPSTDYRLMVVDAFGAKRISDPLTTDAGGVLTVPLTFIEDWIDLGAQLTFTILEDDKNIAIELNFGDDPPDPDAPPITCILLIFDTYGNVTIE
jgi:hypothetical protein